MRYLIKFSYDGTLYSGYQKQNNKPSIQEEIEDGLSKIYNEKIKIHSSGRTDAKVHALCQVAHYDASKDMDLSKLVYSLNSLTNDDIYIKSIKKVSDNFHARYDVKEKEYIYKINVGEYDPLFRNYIYQYNRNLDIESMKKAIKLFLGKHDFKSFSTDTLDKDTIREIYKVGITKNKNIITISFTGNGFLRYMVRNMVGLLIEIGAAKRSIDSVKEILKAKDRTKSGIKAPGMGLYLKHVKYKKS